MQKYPPQVELLPSGNEAFSSGDKLPWHKAPRARLFSIVFLLVAVAGLAYTFLQSPVYQSRASVLMAALTAVDRRSAEADIQHVAIQRRILLGKELIDGTGDRLVEQGYGALSQAEISHMLNVEPIEDTNLVELIAQGHNAAILPVLIDSWVEVYLAARAADIARSMGDTHKRISTEIRELEQKIEKARSALAVFREENNIVSAERAENEALARLKGINDSLNTAREDEVRARSELDTVREAIARGETVVPKQEQQTFSSLELELQKLKLQLAELDQRYTREYLARQPALKVLPQQISELEAELESRSAAGRKVVLNDAIQAHATTQKTVANIALQYAEHKKEVENFTRIFQVHQSRVSDLENLEELHRESQSRLVQLETSQVQRYPQVSVIAGATVAKRVGPNYLLNAAIALGIALLVAIFAVWLKGFLGHQKKDLPPITVTGVRLYPDEGREGLAHQPANAALEQKAHALEAQQLEEESNSEYGEEPAGDEDKPASTDRPENK